MSKHGGVEQVAKAINVSASHQNKKYIRAISLASREQIAYYSPMLGETFIRSHVFGKLKIPLRLDDYIKILRIVRGSDTIIYHLPDPFVSMVAIFIKVALPHKRSVVLWHADTKIVSALGSLLYFSGQVLLLLCDLVITTSPKLKSESLHLAPHKYKCKILLLPFRRPVTPERMPYLGYHEREHDCIYVGRVESYKNVKMAIDAFNLSNARSLLICGQGDDLATLQVYARSIDTFKRIDFVPTFTDTEKYQLISASKMLILPSKDYSEAFGIVQIEAFATATPVISCQIKRSGVAWVNRNNFTGLTCEPNPKSLADSINRIYNKYTWQRMSSNSLDISYLYSQEMFHDNVRRLLEIAY